MTKRLCPMCKSDKIILWMGGYTGAMYRCPDCGYVGPLVIEVNDDSHTHEPGDD